jgi:hypoxanthine phosphoribosyltransferase
MERKVFVIMPSGSKAEYKNGREEADFIYRDIIGKAVKDVFGEAVKVERETEKSLTGVIDKSIIESINDADYCIVDLTGNNPNVFFELGVRFTLWSKHTILLQQHDDGEIPFDIASYRVVRYNPKFSGVSKAITDLKLALQASEDTQERTDSPVYNALRNLKVDRTASGFGNGAQDDSLMPWPEFYAQCQRLERILGEKAKRNGYKPDVIIGITNGGLIFADILARDLFYKIPLLSLWAERHSGKYKYFDNRYNDNVVNSLKGEFPEGKCEILLVDDNVAKGRTFREAIEFLHSAFSTATISFLPAFTRNEKYLDAVGEEHLIWKRPEFSDSPIDLSTIHSTPRRTLPYLKELL